VLEQLKHIRKRMNGSKQLKRQLHSWAFAQIQQFLTYKASKKSIAIEYVSAKYTSTKCSKCGHYQRGQRTRHQFKCQKCGFELNADLNGARNIRRNYQVAQGRSLGDGRAVNPPIVATEESEVASEKKRN
jgi:transposase